jgi:hypothetical protein
MNASTYSKARLYGLRRGFQAGRDDVEKPTLPCSESFKGSH